MKNNTYAYINNQQWFFKEYFALLTREKNRKFFEWFAQVYIFFWFHWFFVFQTTLNPVKFLPFFQNNKLWKTCAVSCIFLCLCYSYCFLCLLSKLMIFWCDINFFDGKKVNRKEKIINHRLSLNNERKISMLCMYVIFSVKPWVWNTNIFIW